MRRIIRIVISAAIFVPLLAVTGGRVQAEVRNIYRWVLEDKVEVAVDYLNIRTGAGLKYPSIGTAKRGDVLEVLGALGNWYVVCAQDESIGVVSRDYVKIHSYRNPGEGDAGEEFNGILNMSERLGRGESDGDESQLLELINGTRLDNALEAYAWDERLNMIARLKAEDMVAGNYFGHFSELYGTPFAMLKQFEIPYRNATESIIGNISVENAFINIMADPVYRGNILNMRYDRVGLGTAESDIYGKIIVLLFIG